MLLLPTDVAAEVQALSMSNGKMFRTFLAELRDTDSDALPISGHHARSSLRRSYCTLPCSDPRNTCRSAVAGNLTGTSTPQSCECALSPPPDARRRLAQRRE